MAAVNFDLKEYQDQALKAFGAFLRDTTAMGANLAFYKATNFPYRNAPAVAEGTPYLCLRIPTGGGKTLVAAHAVGVAYREYLQTTNPMVLWLVPSTPILEQTIAALKDEAHPYRAALTAVFNRNFTVMTKAEALAMPRADATGGAVVIVSTIQSFRREDDSGKENPDGLKVYEDAGVLMDHFENLSDQQMAGLDRIEAGSRPVYSLSNLLKLHRPMVIVDEAHNARTELSFRTLARFNPSLILELTATPQIEHDPARDKHASNILYSVSAAELKAEQMIKMPIRLTTDADWVKTVGAALDCQKALEEAAKAEALETEDYIRPIILFQAQSASASDPHRLTWEKIEQHLLEDHRIPKEHIPSVDAGIQESMRFGVLAGFPVEDIKVTLLDGAYHEVDSSEMAFKIAGSMAFKEAARKANPGLLEPLMAVEVTTPEDYLGTVIGDINSRRGQVQEMVEAHGNKVVRALVPLSEMFGYVGDLRSKTSGQASYSMEFDSYGECPTNVAEEIIAKTNGGK